MKLIWTFTQHVFPEYPNSDILATIYVNQILIVLNTRFTAMGYFITENYNWGTSNNSSKLFITTVCKQILIYQRFR